MNILTLVRDILGFTRNEILVIGFLAAALLAGIALKRFGPSPGTQPPLRSSYWLSDSEFAARTAAAAALGAAETTGSTLRRPEPHAAMPAEQVDINSAGEDLLVVLPGIGPAYAGRIVEYRNGHGRFSTVEELLQVRGIGPKRLEKLRPFITAR